MNSEQSEMLEYLFYRYCDGFISKEEMDKLNSFMLESEYIRGKYFDFIKTELALSHCLAQNFQADGGPNLLFEELQKMADYENVAPAIEPSKEKLPIELIQKVVYPPRERHKVSKLQIGLLVTSAAAMLFFAVFLKFTSGRNGIPIAKVSDGVNTEWLSASGEISVGSPLYPGPLTLKKGVAQIMLDGGARVLLEAPVELDLETASSLYLRKGRLVANIEQSTEQRFVIRTANSTIVDYGTEFGVDVDNLGQTYAYVFKGKVELRQGCDPLKYSNTLPLQAGQSGRANHAGEILRANPDERVRFFTAMPTRYELAVRKTQPLYYWRFDRNPKGPFDSELDIASDNPYQLVGNSDYTNGPDLGGKQSNTALRLTGPQDYAILRDCTAEADNADGFTISMWVRPEVQDAALMDKAGKVIMRVRRKDETGMGHRSTFLFNYIKKQFVFYVGHTSDNPGGLVNEFDTSVSSEAVALDAWYHVVVTYTNSNRMCLYVNGRLNASNKLPDAVRLLDMDKNKEPYRWLVGYGKMVRSEDIKEDRSFTGSIDEISQYNRQLSAEEVQMLYKAAESGSNN
jgi:hypothetical protein